MRSLTVLLLSSTVAFAPLAAQTATPATPATAPAATAPTGAPAATPPAAEPAAAAPAPATAAPTAAAPAAAPTAVAAGQQVTDTAGAAVGSIEAVNNGVATLSTGTTKVAVPVSSFAMGPKGPVIGLTKTEIEAKAAAASKPVNIAVGTEVKGPAGATVGTVKAVTGDMVTVASATASAQLPKTAFAQGDGGLVIGMTPAQFDAAAKAAGGAAKPGAGKG